MTVCVDFSTKCSDHGLDVDLDHAWNVDTGLYVWILFPALEASACLWTDTRLLSCFTGLLQCASCRYTHTAGAYYFHRVRARRHYIHYKRKDNLAFHVHGSPCPSPQVVVTAQDPVLTKTEILFNGRIWKQLDEAYGHSPRQSRRLFVRRSTSDRRRNSLLTCPHR